MERYQVLRNRNIGPRLERKRKTNKAHQKNQRDLLLQQQRVPAGALKECAPKFPAEPVKKSRLELLKEWKLMKEASEKERQKAKRPPFYAGILQTNAKGSPVRRPLTNISSNNVPRRMGTRSQTAARNAAKPPAVLAMTGLKKVDGENLTGMSRHKFNFLLTVPQSPQLARSTRKRVLSPVKQEDIKLDNVSSKRAKPIKNILAKKPGKAAKPTSVAQKMSAKEKETKTVEDNFAELGVARIVYSPSVPTSASKFTHLEYSPNITMGRGKNRRSSVNKSRKFNVDEEIRKEENIKNARIQEFRLFLSNETSRLLSLASKWEGYAKDNPSMPEDAAGDANAVVGKSKLLTSDKFKQFADLIEKCESGDPKVKIDDLQGYHDWVSLEVEDLDKVYMQLDDRCKANWAMPEVVAKAADPPKKKLIVRNTKKPASKPAGGRTNLMAHIQAQRKMMQQQCAASDNADENAEPAPSAPLQASPRVEKNAVATAQPAISPRHALCMKSTPVSVGKTSTPRDNTSLRVQLLRQNSGLHVLAATAMARLSLSPLSTEITLPSPVHDSNVSFATPQASILKISALSAKKSVGFKIDPKYFLPHESSDDSPEILDMLQTPPRRSQRIASRSMDKSLKV